MKCKWLNDFKWPIQRIHVEPIYLLFNLSLRNQKRFIYHLMFNVLVNSSSV